MGASYEALRALQKDLKAAFRFPGEVTIRHVNNLEHPNVGQLYVEIASFWWDE